jgi:hypothetical protein
LATAEGVILELALYGGAIFTLVYGSRETTRDVDAIIKPADIGARLVKQVAAEQDLTPDWLNPDVRQFLSPLGKSRPFPSHEFEPGLQITIPTAAYLLSLKLNACRTPLPGYQGDEADIRFLLGKIKPTSVEQIEEIQDRFFPGEGLHTRALELIQEQLAKTTP